MLKKEIYKKVQAAKAGHCKPVGRMTKAQLLAYYEKLTGQTVATSSPAPAAKKKKKKSKAAEEREMAAEMLAEAERRSKESGAKYMKELDRLEKRALLDEILERQEYVRRNKDKLKNLGKKKKKAKEKRSALDDFLAADNFEF